MTIRLTEKGVVTFNAVIILLFVFAFACCQVDADQTAIEKESTRTERANLGHQKLTSTPTSVTENNSDDPSELPLEVEITGEQGKAISIAFEKFEADTEISVDKRKASSYRIQLRQSKTRYYIFFRPRLAEGEKPSLGGETSLGVDATYILDRRDLSFVGRTFFK